MHYSSTSIDCHYVIANRLKILEEFLILNMKNSTLCYSKTDFFQMSPSLFLVQTMKWIKNMLSNLQRREVNKENTKYQYQYHVPQRSEYIV